MSDKNTISFRFIPLRQNFPKTIDSEITFRIYAGDTNDQHVKRSSYYNISILGNLPELSLNVEYDVVAREEIKNNEPQYKVVSIKRRKPMNDNDVTLFLSEILTPTQVSEIMKHYPNIIDIVSKGETDTIDVTKLHGIGDYIIKVIEKKILQNYKFADIISEFGGLLDFELLKKLSAKHTSVEGIKREIKNNPYECLTELDRVGFKIADKTILNFDKECKKKHKLGESVPFLFDYDILTSKQRASACVDYILNENENNGNTKMVTEDVIKEVKSLAPECFKNIIEVLKNKDKYVLKNPYIAKKYTYETEEYIAETIKFAMSESNNIKWDFNTTKYKEQFGLTEEQFGILENVCDNNIAILNGFAGSGKSHTLKAIIQMMKDNGVENYMLSAPTGKAVKIIKHYTKEEAMTIHRMLGAKGNNNFDYGLYNKLLIDALFIDESSMLDIFLTRHLFEAIDFKKTKLILIGDSAQLPSVSCGNVFHDLMESDIPKTTLTKVFRYGIGGISTVATNTRRRKKTIEGNETKNVVGDDKAYVYFNLSQERIIPNILKLYKKLLETNNPEDISVLTAYNKGDYGTIVLNNHLQAIANPKSKIAKENYIKVVDTKFYVNDIIMQTVNNYKAILYVDNDISISLLQKNEKFIPNGEVGKIISIIPDKQIAVIKFDEDTVLYDIKSLYDCKLGYAISLHRMQGSSNKTIILITPKAHTYMLNSNLLYVGVTRATQQVYHFGEIDTFNRAVKIKENFDRLTFLQDMI